MSNNNVKTQEKKITVYKVNLIKGEAAIKKGIGAIDKQLAAPKMFIHQLAYSVLNHYKEHGDYTLCQTMIDGIKSKAIKEKVTLFFTTYSMVNFNTETKQLYHVKKKTFDLETAQQKPWFTLKPQETVKIEKTAGELLKSFMDRLQKDNAPEDWKQLAKALNIVAAQFEGQVNNMVTIEKVTSQVKQEAA